MFSEDVGEKQAKGNSLSLMFFIFDPLTFLFSCVEINGANG